MDATIQQAFNDAGASLRSALAGAQNPTDHALPISEIFIHSHSGAEAVQVCSGQSVVIIELGRKAYKHCLDPHDGWNGYILHGDLLPVQKRMP